MLHLRHWSFIIVSFAFGITAFSAENDWPVCSNFDVERSASAQRTPLRPADLDQQAIYIEADQALFREQGSSELRGNVHLSQADQQVHAENLRFDRQTGELVATQGVELITSEIQLQSQGLSYNLNTRSGQLEGVAYLLTGNEGRGASQRVIQEGKERTRLEQASYTTCPPGQNSWRFEADAIELDHVNEKGSAHNMRLKVRDTTVAYLPYFTFPLSDQRQSGFLSPTFGSDEKSGLRLSVPYYFNMAPNYDLTVTGNFLSERGWKLDSSFRYLFKNHHGQFDYQLLPQDKRANNEARSFFQIAHDGQWGDNTQLTLKASGVSDKRYFTDLGSSLAASSVVNLERSLTLTHKQDDWFVSALVQNYQILDSVNETYARLPQLTAQYQLPPNALKLEAKATGEYSYFSSSAADDGQRLDVDVAAKRRFANSYSYIEPQLRLQHTHYAQNSEDKLSSSRTLPTLSLDSGVFFERELFNGERLQTLEPRIFYTFTPYKEQSHLPVFDSASRTLSYDQLFSDRLFSGKDRVADTNRLSTSLTTRLQHNNKGREIFRASVGQIYYFDERKVTLPEETNTKATRSEVVIETAGDLNANLRLSSTALVDTKNREFSTSQVRLNYRDPQQRLLNLAYAQRRGDYEAAHISGATPINQQWKIVAAYEHDLKTGRGLESVAGLEYQTCCWKSRIALRRYLLSDNKTYDHAVLVEFELKGLGNIGSRTRNFLENQIYGYE